MCYLHDQPIIKLKTSSNVLDTNAYFFIVATFSTLELHHYGNPLSGSITVKTLVKCPHYCKLRLFTYRKVMLPTKVYDTNVRMYLLSYLN